VIVSRKDRQVGQTASMGKKERQRQVEFWWENPKEILTCDTGLYTGESSEMIIRGLSCEWSQDANVFTVNASCIEYKLSQIHNSLHGTAGPLISFNS
jgi:hypothetical protein